MKDCLGLSMHVKVIYIYIYTFTYTFTYSAPQTVVMRPTILEMSLLYPTLLYSTLSIYSTQLYSVQLYPLRQLNILMMHKCCSESLIMLGTTIEMIYKCSPTLWTRK